MTRPNILINTSSGYLPICEEEIICLKAQGSYTMIFTQSGDEFMISKKLKQVENVLNPTLFFRIHHSHVINLSFIKVIKNGNINLAVMENDIILEISKRKKAEFFALFKRL